jgi:hypothetical protein
MSTISDSDRDEAAAAALPDEFFVLLGLLRSMSDEGLLTDQEMERFFSLVEPAQTEALESERAKAAAAGRKLTHGEVHAALASGLLGAAGNAAREVWGAEIGALVDGKKPS